MNRKELKEQYKQYRPEMGIISYRCAPTDKSYLFYSQNIKADINSITFQLSLNSFPPNDALLNDWKKYGQAAFEILTLEKLDYSKDETKTDYTRELKLLREISAEKLTDFEFVN